MAQKKPTKSKARRQARKLTKAAKADLKAFRKSISALKRLGLAFSRTDTKKTRATKKKRLKIAEFSDVLEGKAKALKINKKGAEAYKKANLPGIRVAGSGKTQRIITPIVEREKTYVRNGELYRKRLTPQGQVISRSKVLPLKITANNIQSFIDQLRDNPNLERKLSKGKQWSFRFFGNNSYGTFDTLELLANYFEDYPTVQLSMRESLEAQQDIIEAFELFQMTPWEVDPSLEGYERPRRRYSRSDYAKTLYRRTMERNPARHEAELARKRKAAANWYEKHKEDQAFLERKRAYNAERYRKVVKAQRQEKRSK